MHSFKKILSKGPRDDKERLIKNEKEEKNGMKPNKYGGSFSIDKCKDVPYHRLMVDKYANSTRK